MGINTSLRTNHPPDAHLAQREANHPGVPLMRSNGMMNQNQRPTADTTPPTEPWVRTNAEKRGHNNSITARTVDYLRKLPPGTSVTPEDVAPWVGAEPVQVRSVLNRLHAKKAKKRQGISLERPSLGFFLIPAHGLLTSPGEIPPPAPEPVSFAKALPERSPRSAGKSRGADDDYLMVRVVLTDADKGLLVLDDDSGVAYWMIKA